MEKNKKTEILSRLEKDTWNKNGAGRIRSRSRNSINKKMKKRHTVVPKEISHFGIQEDSFKEPKTSPPKKKDNEILKQKILRKNTKMTVKSDDHNSRKSFNSNSESEKSSSHDSYQSVHINSMNILKKNPKIPNHINEKLQKVRNNFFQKASNFRMTKEAKNRFFGFEKELCKDPPEKKLIIIQHPYDGNLIKEVKDASKMFKTKN